MHVRVGCEFSYKALGPTPTIWQVRPRPEGPHKLVTERWETTPAVPVSSYLDAYGNLCNRLMLPEGSTTVRFDAVMEVPEGIDDADPAAAQVPIEQLPDEALVFLLPSRFCLSDVLHDKAWELFGAAEAGYGRAQAVSDWVHEHIRFDDTGVSTTTTTAVDVFESGAGVCRDFAQLAVTFLRSLNMPARYVFGYLPDIGVPDPGMPMDFCAWLEVYLGGRWFTLDPRNNARRTGRVVIGRGRDALDVAMVTSYGGAVLEAMSVWADEAG